jgi:predicted RNA binding protein YcfA (HicA-like mRNA interferase family)
MSAKLPVISGERLIKILVKNGFSVKRQAGSHVVLQKGEVVFRFLSMMNLRKAH